MTSLEHKTDEELMSFLQEGSESAFNEIYDRYGNRILYFMFKMLKNDEAKAQDFTQDVFMKVVEKAEQFDTSKSFKTWVFTIAANLCKNYFRDHKHWQELECSQNEVLLESRSEREFDHAEFKRHLLEEIDVLKSPFKETFVLRFYEELKLKEIAKVMDCPLGTVKSRLNQAIKILSKKLEAYQVLVTEKKKIK